ncbi:MAG TPA: DUF6029 family protein [Polyangiaceae bacterium LLY-WYZ-15_(1-7)]|nr:hypothetical protein [Myxococcales bacterium]MAT24564.1 hypothetical protein [Sandaracinus sp.]HJL03603.1 DUF6029 family protein [Polyangiaceae bacterium LLY-WYZ-15_(1-7)]HJL12752.1 DUF6029 family protein [Polyangiaceae bacterium LLY-WYZ-15_(1-7)]HJL21132.1 DUF6029 family protein [Polyangiaceae bacterium LLY-WYZ-15_(1-7)]
MKRGTGRIVPLAALLLIGGRVFGPAPSLAQSGEPAGVRDEEDGEAAEPSGDSDGDAPASGASEADASGSEDADESAEVEGGDAEADPYDDWELPDDLDEEAAGEGDDWELPDDLDEGGGDGAGDEWDFSAADEAIAAEEDQSFFESLTYTITSTTVAQYRTDNFNRFDGSEDSPYNDDDFLALWERLEMAVQGEQFRLTARVDGFFSLFEDACPESFERADCIDDDLRLERFTAHVEHEGLTIDAVDSYAVLGRGIALSMRRVDILGVDTSLRGGQVAYDRDRVFVRVLGGAANPQNLDPQTLLIRREPVDRLRGSPFSEPGERDWIVGGEAGVRLGADADVELGVHGQRVWFARNEVAERRTTVDVAGWSLSLPALADGKLTLYGELNALQRRRDNDLIEDEESTGYAVYAQAQLQLGSLTVLTEWKDYSNYIVAETNRTAQTHRIYSAAPTLERDAERPRALYNTRGGRLQVDYGFLPGPWSLSVNALVYGHAEDEDVDPFDGILVTHGYARIQKVNDAVGEDEIGWTFEVVGGARRESYLQSPFADVNKWELDWRVFHVQVDAGLVIGRHSLEMTFIHRDERLRNFALVDYERGQLAFTYSWAGKLRVSPVLNWNTENRDNPAFYPGIEARYDFLEGSFLRLFYGRTPGGRICSGGVCRDVPPFEGGIAEVVLRI